MATKGLENFQKVKAEEERMERTVNSCPFRTRFHIMPPVGWINDPNGLCQFKGVYHAYFQYSPLNVNGGGGYWGHCVSTDLIRWEYKDPVLTTDIPEDRSGVYSGSALVEDGRMYVFYTGNVKMPGDYDYIDAGRVSTQILVESEDGQHMSEKVKLLGMEDYPEEITQHVRDPKVWKENGRYYMILGARERAWDEEGKRRDRGTALVYVSEDRKKWKFSRKIDSEETFGYMWECPDLFCLEGEKVLSFCPQGLKSEEEKFQNIYQSGYSLLSRDADLESTFREWDMGFDFYAPQSFEADDGRRILIGWAGMPDTADTHRNLSVKNGWQHCLTIPCELEYREGRIFRTPVRELFALEWEAVPEEKERYCWAEKAVKLEVSVRRRTRIRIGTEKNEMTITAEGNKTEISFLDRNGNPAVCGGGRGRRVCRTAGDVENLLILIDSSIVEFFINGGEAVFTTRIYLEREEREIRLLECEKYRLEMI